MNIRNRVCSFIRAALIVGALIAGGFVAPDDAHSQVGGPYSKFGPVNGILKGSVSTYNTSAAASTDVVSLWSGTCDATHFLAGNGTCAIPPGTGVTSVTETVPSGFAISGSPGTGAVSLAISYATGQSANLFLATPNGTTGALSERAIVGADLPPINLASTANGGVTGTLPVTNGGNGLATATLGDLRYGSGTNTLATLAGNTTSTKNFLTQTGTGSVSAAPSWGTLAGGDLPPINLGSTANGGVSSSSILLGTNGGTSNGFFSITGPTTSLKTFTFPNASANVLTDNALVTVAQGGTGANTLTGLLSGNGTSPIGAATSANVISKWTGTCSSTTFLRGDGQCITPTGTGGTPGGANTNVQFNNSGAFGADSGFTYAGSSGAITHSGTLNSALAISQTNSSNGTAATSQIQLLNDTPSSAYYGIAGSGNTQVQFLNGPTGAQVYYGTSNNIPVIFGQNNQYRFGLTNSVSGETARIIALGTGATSQAYWAWYDNAGTRLGYFGKASAASLDISYEADNALDIVANNGTGGSINIDTSHNITLNGNAITSSPTHNFNNGLIASGARPTLNSANSGFYAGATTGGIAQIAFVDSAGATNSKMFDIFADTNSMNFRLDNDANTAATTWLQVVRSGTNVTGLTLGSPSVLINNTSGGGSGATLTMGGGSAFVGMLNTGAGSGAFGNIIASTSSGLAGSTAIAFDTSGSVTMSNLASNTGAGSYVCWIAGLIARNGSSTCLTSAARFKEKITDLDGAGLNTVLQMRPVSFNYNAEAIKSGTDASRQVGFIAEDVEKIDKRLVSYGGDGKLLGVRYENYTAVLTKAVQQQQKEIDTLRIAVGIMFVWLTALTIRRRKA